MNKAIICPTVTAFELHEYREQMEVAESMAERVHIDLMDGEFAPSQSPDLDQIWLSGKLVNDIHLMYQRPMEVIDRLISLKPNLVIVHAEANLNHGDFIKRLHDTGIKVGLALLPNTSVQNVSEILSGYDHALVFSGNLGHHGGHADLSLLGKVREIRQKFPQIEISWDGGINDQNAQQLTDAGVNVLNVGGFIQKSSDPADAYQTLLRELRASI